MGPVYLPSRQALSAKAVVTFPGIRVSHFTPELIQTFFAEELLYFAFAQVLDFWPVGEAGIFEVQN